MIRKSMASLIALLVVPTVGPALAQDACATFHQQAGQLAGMAGAEPVSMKSGKNTICELRNKDNTVHANLIVMPNDRPAQALTLYATMAKQSKEPGRVVKDEPSLGAGAYVLLEKDQLQIQAAGKDAVYALSLNRDNGLAAADADQMRAIAKRVISK